MAKSKISANDFDHFLEDAEDSHAFSSSNQAKKTSEFELNRNLSQTEDKVETRYKITKSQPKRSEAN